MIISRSVLRIINVSDQSCKENQNTHFMFCNSPPPPPPSPENRVVYEIMWEKFYRVGQSTDNNMADAHGMLDT